MTILIALWLGGCIPSAVMAYEDWEDNLLSWDDAVMSCLLWPVLTTAWALKLWRSGDGQ